MTAALEELALMGHIEEVKALSKEAKQRFANIPDFSFFLTFITSG